MAKITKVVAADGSVSYTEAETTLIDDGIEAVLAPVGLVSDDGTEFISKRVAGMSSAAYGIGGFLLGERQGHKRASDGKDPLVGGAVVQ